MSEAAADSAAGARLARHPALATLLIAATATSFALGTSVIRFAYQAGAGTVAIVVTRTSIAAIGLALTLKLLGVPIRLDRREKWATPLIGLCMAGYSGCFYMGLEYMPVGLTVLTFYTYPLMTGVASWSLGQERIAAAGWIALPLAFLGLVLALDVRSHGFSPIGALWAMAGAAGFSGVLILSALLLPRRSDTRPRTVPMLATAAVVATSFALLTHSTWFPQTALGWAALLFSSLCYLVGMTSVLFCAATLGATRVSLVMNVEPLASLVLAFLILGETLSPLQIAGAVLVVAAIFLFRAPRAAA